MNAFYLDTEVLSTKAEEIKIISKDLSNLINELDSLNFSGASEFDFSGAVAAIRHNLSVSVDSVSWFEKYFTTVIDSHSTLQVGLQNSIPSETQASVNNTNKSASSSPVYTSSNFSPSESSHYSASDYSSLADRTAANNALPHPSESDVAYSNTSTSSSSSTTNQFTSSSARTASSSSSSYGNSNSSRGVNGITVSAGTLLDAMTSNQRRYANFNVNVTGPSVAAGAVASTALADVMSSILDKNKKDSDTSSANFEDYFLSDYDNPILNDYGYNQTIKEAGSAPVSMAMVASYLTGEKQDPVALANWSLAHNFRDQEKGTSFEFFESISEGYGINCIQSDVSKDAIISALNENNPIIIYINENNSEGHYVVLKELTATGEVITTDPAANGLSARTWNIEYFLNHGAQMWAFSKKEETPLVGHV